MDLFTVPTVTGRVLFVLVLPAHHRRRIVHFAITEHPTASWTAQQIIEAFPDDSRLDGSSETGMRSTAIRSDTA
jgi:putative transposase